MHNKQDQIKLIETHAHLDFPEIFNRMDKVILNAKENYISKIISISTNLNKIEKIISISENYSDVFFTVGVHPNEVGKDLNYNNYNMMKDLTIHPREHDLVIGTFGRAAWILDDIRPLREIANDPSLTNRLFKLFSPPDSYLASIQQPTGSRFGGDAIFNGTNRTFGAQIKYFFNPDSIKFKDINKDTI